MRKDYRINSAIKLVDTWCRLKALAGYSSVIKDVYALDTFDALECCPKTMRTRLCELQKLGWLTVSYKQVVLVAWKRLHHLLGMNFIPEWFVKPPKLDNEKTTHYWVYSAEIHANKESQTYMVCRKVAKNHAVEAEFYNELKGAGADIERCESDGQYLCAQLLKLYVNGFVNGGSASYELLRDIRPDTNRGILRLGIVYNDQDGDIEPRKLSEADRLRYSMRGAYVKRMLVKEKLATVQQGGTVQSECRQRNKHCTVKYNKGETAAAKKYGAFTTFTRLCDDTVPRLAPPRSAVVAGKTTGKGAGKGHAA